MGTEKAHQQLQALFDALQEQKKEKPAVSISSIKTDTWLEVQSTAKLSFRIVEDLPASALKYTEAFGWDDRNERAQSDRYDYWMSLLAAQPYPWVTICICDHLWPCSAFALMRHLVGMNRYIPHLRQTISLGSRSTDWVDAANRHPQLLSYDGLETLGRNFRGTTDVLVANRSAIRARQPGLGMRLLFKLKKVIKDSDVIHAQASLLLANLHSPDTRPMLVSLELGPGTLNGMHGTGF